MFPPGRGVRERASVLALSCALLWAVHPLTTSAVTYLVQRVESLMALCVLLTLYCSIRAWSGSRWWTAAAVSACAAGMASKESMVAAPLLVVIWDAVFSGVQPWRALLRSSPPAVRRARGDMDPSWRCWSPVRTGRMPPASALLNGRGGAT